jgi:Uma2 family endonuclease
MNTMTREEMLRIKEDRGYSLKRLSEFTGVPVVTLQKVFSGATPNPRKATLDAIERVLTSDEERYRGKSYEYTSRISDKGMTLNEDIGYNYDLEKELQGEYTLKDYYALPDSRRVELIDGLFYDMASPKTVHQDIIFYIHMSLYEYIRDKKKPCKVFESPVDVQLDCDDKTMLEPDVMVVCDRDKIKEFGIYGAPDFILEVISKSSRQKDMTIKLRKYQAAGVREYWIIDPYKEVLITYDLTDEDYIPNVHPLEGSVPVLISNGELEIDLEPVAESIRELVKQIKD